jgi:hypothetical protein
VDEYPYDDGSWKNQLLCIPAVDRVAIHITWWRKYWPADNPDVVRKVFTNKIDTGVTMGEFVRTVRKLMAEWTVKDLKKFAEELVPNECQDCGRSWSEDGYDMPQTSSSESGSGSESESDGESMCCDGRAEQTSEIKLREFW